MQKASTVVMYLIDEEDVKAKAKGQNKDGNNDGKPCDRCNHVVEHEDEDAKVADEAKLEEEVQPGGRDDEGAKGPLPALKRVVSNVRFRENLPTVPPLHPRVSN